MGNETVNGSALNLTIEVVKVRLRYSSDKCTYVVVQADNRVTESGGGATY